MNQFMIARRIWQKVCFRFRLRASVQSTIRRLYLRARGARIGGGTFLPRANINWPHQLSIGANCILEDDIYFKWDGPWHPGPSIIIEDASFIGRGCEFNIRKTITIGAECRIASGCKFIDHDHAIEPAGRWDHVRGREEAIRLDKQVWLGVNVVVLRGVTIGQGAIVGAGAVVTKSIPPNEIWAGIPARCIGCRPGAGSVNR